MDLEKEESRRRERHFVLHVMSFVYGLSLKPLPRPLKQMLNKYSREYEKYCTKNITQAILICICDYMASEETLVDIDSQAYQDLIQELSEMYEPYKFLKFMAHYTLKSRSDYYRESLFDSPIKFYSSIVLFFDVMRANNRIGVDFWERLDKVTAAVVATTLPFKEHKAYFCDDENGSSEKEFVLMLMKIVSDLYSNPLPDCLRRKLDELMLVSQTDFPPEFKTALTILCDSLERSVLFFEGDDEPMYDFYHRLATKSFTARFFLEFCLSCTRRALLEYYVKSNNDSPMKAFDRLCYILQKAKRDCKLYTLNAMIFGANEIIEDEKMRKRALNEPSDASTELVSDISTESSDSDTMFKSFEQSLPTIDSVNAATSKNAQSAIASTSHAQSTIDNVIAPAREAQPFIKRKISLAQGNQPDTKTGIAPAKIFRSATENVIATGENAQPAIENVIATGENAQSESANVIATGENVQAVIENVIPSGDNAEAGEPENLLVSSGEAANASSCRCCTTF